MDPRWMILFNGNVNQNERIEVFESSLVFTGIHFKQEEGKAGNYIEAHYTLTQNVTIQNCDIDMNKKTSQTFESFLNTFESYYFVIKDCKITLTGPQNRIAQHIGFGRGCDQPFFKNKIDFFNNTVTKMDEGFFEEEGAVMSLRGANNGTIQDNKFYNLGGGKYGIFQFLTASLKACSAFGNTKVIVKNNYFQGHPEFTSPRTTLIHVDNRDKLDFLGHHYLIVEDNVFENFKFEGEVIRINLVGKHLEQVLIQRNIFRDFHFADPTIPFLHSQTAVTIKSNVFENMNFNTLARITEDLELENLRFRNIIGSFSELQSFIEISNADYLYVKDLDFQNMQQKAQYFTNIANLGQVEIEGIIMKDSSFSTDIFSIADTYKVAISNIELHNFSRASQDIKNFYLLSQRNFLIKETNFQYSLSNIEVIGSSLGLLKLESVLSEPSEAKPELQISFENVEFSDCVLETKSTQGFIYLPPFISKDFELKLKNLDLDFASSDQALIEARSNQKLSIEGLRLQDYHKQLFLLQPAATSNEVAALEVEVKGLDFENAELDQYSLIEGTKNTKFTLKDSSIRNVNSLNRGAVLSLDSNFPEYTYLLQNTFFENCSSIQGGVAFAIGGSTIQFEDSVFQDNFAVQGAIGYVTDQGSISFTKSQFEDNYAYQARILFAINAQHTNQVLDCNFLQNGLKTSLTFRPQFQNKLQKNQIFITKNYKEAFFVAYRSKIEIQGSLSLESTDSFLLANAQSQIQFSEVLIQDSIVQSLAQVSQSSFEIDGLIIENLSQKNFDFSLIEVRVFSDIQLKRIEIISFQGSLIFQEQSNLTIEKLDYRKQVPQETEQPLISLFSSSTLSLKDSSIEEFESNGEYIIHASSSNLGFHNLTVNQSKQKFLGLQDGNFKGEEINLAEFTLNGLQEPSIEIYHSNFELSNSKFKKFQGFSVLESINSENDQQDLEFKITGSDFQDIKATKGSAIKLVNVDLDLKNSVFERNEAETDGGSLLLKCSINSHKKCQYNISRTTFTDNKAEKGGAIYFDLYPPTLEQTVFENNQASSGYGKDIGSYPMELRLKSLPDSFNSGFPSEEESWEIQVFDSFGNPYTLDSPEKLSASSEDLKTSVLGIKNAEEKKGVFTFSELYFLGQPGEQGSVSFNTDLIDPLKYYKVMDQDLQPLTATFKFRDCVEGEILKDSKCEECPKNSYQLFRGETKCNFCPANFKCLGQDNLEVEKGFWRSSEESTKAIQCLNPEACPGGSEVTCSKGFEGPLCAKCSGQTDEGYFAKASAFSCQVCEDDSIIILKLLGVVLMILAYLCILVVIIIQSASRDQYSSVLLRIFTNYLQVTLVVRNLKIHWPNRIENMLEALSVTQTIQQDFFQFGCLFRESKSSHFALNLVILCLSPFILSLVGFGFWKALSKISPQKFRKTLKRNSILTALTSAYLSFPIINSYIYQSFNCKKIDGKSFFIEDFSMECYGSEHIIIIILIVIPAVLVWSIGFPFLTLKWLRKNLKTLDDKDTIIKYGLFYIGLKDETYYWEIIVSNYRKMAIVITAASVTESRSFFQLLLVFTILYLNHFALQKVNPYSEKWLNQIDQHASAASISAVILGLLYVEESSAQSSFQLEVVFYILLMVNITFLVRWAFNLGLIYVQKVRQKVEKKQNNSEIKTTRQDSGFHYNRYKKSNEIRARNLERKKQTQAMQEAYREADQANTVRRLKVPNLQDLLEEEEFKDMKAKSSFYQR